MSTEQVDFDFSGLIFSVFSVLCVVQDFEMYSLEKALTPPGDNHAHP
jgi:hypothetical protein